MRCESDWSSCAYEAEIVSSRLRGEIAGDVEPKHSA